MPPTLTPLRAVGVVLLGVVVGLIGTGVHRAAEPIGLLVAFAIVVSAGVVVRAWTGWRGVPLLAGVLLVVLLAVNYLPRGGDVVIAAQPVGYAWFGCVPLALATLLLPRRWFSETPIGGSSGRESVAP